MPQSGLATAVSDSPRSASAVEMMSAPRAMVGKPSPSAARRIGSSAAPSVRVGNVEAVVTIRGLAQGAGQSVAQAERSERASPMPATSSHGAPTKSSEEHTSALQSLMRISYAVFCLQQKNKPTKKIYNKLQHQ